MSAIDSHQPVTINFGSAALTGTLQYDHVNADLALLTDEGTEQISTDLMHSHGIVSAPGNIIIKDWSEHSGLAQSLADTGLVTLIEEHTIRPHGAGGYSLTAYEVQLNLG